MPASHAPSDSVSSTRRPAPGRRLRRLLAAASLSVAAGPASAGWNAPAETIQQHPTWIYTPSTALPNGKHPLLFVLHGCMQTHTELKNFGNLVPTAEANGVVLAVPSVGSEAFGPGCWDYDRAADSRGHVAELVKLADVLKGRPELNVDPNHVYMVGLSSGAAMALAVGCTAPDVFAGIGAIAGPSVGSSQSIATQNAGSIPPNNVSNAIAKCKSLAGSREPHFATQIANIAYGDMDRNGPKAMFDFAPLDSSHAGQIRVVSIKWSQDNVEVLRSIYGTGPLGPAQPVQNGVGTQQVATKDNLQRLSLVVAHNVGHAWPAGTGSPNSANQGGLWIAQSGLDYAEYAVGWLIKNNMRAQGQTGIPQVTLNTSGSNDAITVAGAATDPDGAITRVDTILSQADASGGFQQKDSHINISLAQGGNYSDTYGGLAAGWYRVRVTAVDNTGNAATRVSQDIPVGNPPPPTACHDFTDNNFGHVQKGRALVCGFGFTCARGSGDNLGLFNVFVTSSVTEVSPGVFRKGVCSTH